MIQAVADDEERGALGMHYTSVPNILKVLNPHFLDDLRAQLEEAADLVAGPNVEVVARSTPLSDRALMQFGNHPDYGTELMFPAAEGMSL
jgi:hypothetical protein